jgi:Crp-like helix-turn-helix protein
LHSARPPEPTGNRLLDRLSSAEHVRVLRDCEAMDLAFGAVLGEPGSAVRDVYFPTGSAISSLLPMGGGHMIEVALTGGEGVHGMHGVGGTRAASRSTVRSVVRVAGGAQRMRTTALRRWMSTDTALSGVLHAYGQAVIAQLGQAAGCIRFHCVEQRVARLLLMTADRAHVPTLALTHEQLAYALGVRRVGVTNAVGALQREGLISYGRAVVTILDRRRLERASCGCYRADLDTYERALPTAG